MLRSDPSSRSRAVDPASPEAAEQDQRDAGYLAHLASTLATHGGAAASANLALDLVLNEIVEQTRLATTATGAAIALTQGDELVCRATTGTNAPDLGVRLKTRSGLSGACLQTREVQRCDDTQADPRVDAEACRKLSLRSILIVPLLEGGSFLGAFEIFSSRPHAFGDREVQTLQAFSKRIIQSIHHAAEAAAPSAIAPAAEARLGEFEAAVPAPQAGGQEVLQEVPARRRDYWTDALSVLVVALTLLLGWMLGRAGWEKTTARARKPAPAPAQVESNQPPPVPQPDGTASSVPAASTQRPADSAEPKQSSKARSGSELPAPGGLIVSQDGKVIFRMAPAQDTNSPSLAGTEQQQASAGANVSGQSSPLSIPPEVASASLIHRVEPRYPDEARQLRVQGPVVLQVMLAKDGTVQVLKLVSGDPRLAAAAMDAVQQWRFKPYLRSGQPVAVRTQITVNFTLP